MKTILLIIFSIFWLGIIIYQVTDLIHSIREGKFLDARITYLIESYYYDEDYIGYEEFRRRYFSDRTFRKKWSKRRKR